MELGIASKRKLGFVQGTIAKSNDDPVKAEIWNTCNNMVIAWLTNSVIDPIAKSVLFINSARDIWIQLEKRFSLSNGSRKYQINKEIYSLKQNHTPVSEYYTNMRCLWEELESMSQLPQISIITDEIKGFTDVMIQQREEQRLFKFLNGLDDVCKSQRSQMLLMTPLPTVEMACSMLQQEETQIEVLDFNKLDVKLTALYSRNEAPRCSQCGNKGHTNEKC